MNKTKAIIAVLIHIALIVFILVMIWPALKGDSKGYNTKTSGVIVSQPVVDMEEPEMTAPVVVVEEVIEEAIPEAPVIDDSMPEPEVMEPEVIEDVVVPSEPAPAKEPTVHEVKAQVTAFSPLVLFISLGDLVAWSNMNGHDTQSLEGLIPEGAEAWHSKLGEDYQRTFTVEGVYLYKCTPHFGAGMGGVIVVGNPTNFEAILASGQKGAAKRLVKKAAAAIAAQGL